MPRSELPTRIAALAIAARTIVSVLSASSHAPMTTASSGTGWLPRPEAVGVISNIYTRANMIASGKMFLANNLTATLLPFFSWNPLFHIIDQTRGYAFINYNPHNSSLMYPIYVSLVLVMLGLLGEFFTRKRVSLSWAARR